MGALEGASRHHRRRAQDRPLNTRCCSPPKALNVVVSDLGGNAGEGADAGRPTRWWPRSRQAAAKRSVPTPRTSPLGWCETWSSRRSANSADSTSW